MAKHTGKAFACCWIQLPIDSMPCTSAMSATVDKPTFQNVVEAPVRIVCDYDSILNLTRMLRLETLHGFRASGRNERNSTEIPKPSRNHIFMKTTDSIPPKKCRHLPVRRTRPE